MREFTEEEYARKVASFHAYEQNYGKFDFIRYAAELVLRMQIERDFWKSESMHHTLEKRKHANRIRNVNRDITEDSAGN